MESTPWISVAVPCYNSAAYMDICIQSLLDASADPEDLQIIIVDDGSTRDETPQKADEWQERHPDLIRAVHQKNAGHGGAVLTGLEHARGRYFKVVDSDDWVDPDALRSVLTILREKQADEVRLDLLITNYVYENVDEGTQRAIGYRSVMPEGELFSWDTIGTFKPHQNLLMHSLLYRTELLRQRPLPLPKHTFYVDNIYAYVPLPRVKSMLYADLDLYCYQIGRDDQSVNEKVMISRIDQQLRITRIMIDAYDLERDIHKKRLRDYMYSYLTLMMVVCTIFTRMSDDPDAEPDLQQLWTHLRRSRPDMYRRIRYNALSVASSLPGGVGKRMSLGLYHVAQRVFGFN